MFTLFSKTTAPGPGPATAPEPAPTPVPVQAPSALYDLLNKKQLSGFTFDIKKFDELKNDVALINWQNVEDKNTALHLAANDTDLTLFADLLNNEGVDINLQNKAQQTALDIIIKNRTAPSFKIALDDLTSKASPVEKKY